MQADSTAPVALFVYNRLWHTRQTVEALLRNKLAENSDIFIFSDGAKDVQDQPKVDEVRGYIHQIKGFKNIEIRESDENNGLANSIIAGVTEIINKFGSIIVLEDDMVTSPYFLTYMNDALKMYAREQQVISIHGYSFPVNAKLPDTFFLKGTDCWGWATWTRGWNLFEPDSRKLIHQIENKKIKKQFDYNNCFPFFKMLCNQAEGKIDSWAIRWYASAFLNNKLTLYPNVSLLQNIGFSSESTHCKGNDRYEVELTTDHLPLKKQEIIENKEAAIAVGIYLKSTRIPFFKRLWQAILFRLKI